MGEGPQDAPGCSTEPFIFDWPDFDLTWLLLLDRFPPELEKTLDLSPVAPQFHGSDNAKLSKTMVTSAKRVCQCTRARRANAGKTRRTTSGATCWTMYEDKMAWMTACMDGRTGKERSWTSSSTVSRPSSQPLSTASSNNPLFLFGSVVIMWLSRLAVRIVFSDCPSGVFGLTIYVY